MQLLWWASKLAQALRKNPAFIKEVLRMLHNDAKALLGIVKYDFPIIFIAGLPKSGTTWVETQLANLAGYNLRPVYDANGDLAEQNVSDAVFDVLPKWGYSILKLHTRYSKQNYRVITRHVRKFMVMTRDLRDMCVSAYFHVKNDKNHSHYELYNQISLEDGLAHRIEVTGKLYVTWVMDWLNIAEKHPEVILLVRYDDLVAETEEQFVRIHEFFNLPINKEIMVSVSDSRFVGEQDIGQILEENLGLRMKSTARKGICGDWKNYFSQSHKDSFKRLCGDALIRSGYEKDLDW